MMVDEEFRGANNSVFDNVDAFVSGVTYAGIRGWLRSTFVNRIRQEYSYDFTQLLSEIGGSWGLFLGISLINILDAIDRSGKILRASALLGNKRHEVQTSTTAGSALAVKPKLQDE
jgi:hypothetical protein